MTLRNQYLKDRRPFFLRLHEYPDKTVAFSPSVLEFTKPEMRNIGAGPVPTFGSRRPCSRVKQTNAVIRCACNLVDLSPITRKV